MKTNKLWSIMMMLVLVLGTMVAFSSCSKDDDDTNGGGNPIIGTWCVSNKEWTFMEGGKGLKVELGSAGNIKESHPFAWKTEGNTLTLILLYNESDFDVVDINDKATWKNYDVDTAKYTISGNKMTWDGSYVLTRK